MTRICYLIPAPQTHSGGAKMAYRHVEALTALGYDAVIRAPGARTPEWFDHTAPVEPATGRPGPDDILVVPEDAHELMAACAAFPNRKVVFCQNPFRAAAAFSPLAEHVRSQYRTFMTCSPGVALWVARYLDHDVIGAVPAFADERLFAPGPKVRVIAAMPRKRPLELRAIRHMFGRVYPRAAEWNWTVIERKTEAETARALSHAAVYLSLAQLEGMCLSTAEAMASGCLVAGFTGVGVREYATTMNGLWVDDDDCEAAAAALARACELADEDGAGAHLMRHAARTTAAQWSHAACVEALAVFWRDAMGVHPTLPKPGPLL